MLDIIEFSAAVLLTLEVTLTRGVSLLQVSHGRPCTADICGVNAECYVRYHRVLCSCPTNTRGDPYTRCDPIQTTGKSG